MWQQSKRKEHHDEFLELRNSLKYEIRSMKNERWERKCAELNAHVNLYTNLCFGHRITQKISDILWDIFRNGWIYIFNCVL